MKQLVLKMLMQFYHHQRQLHQWTQVWNTLNALAGKPFQAFPGQDHRAHITAHLNFMSTNIVRNNPAVMAAIQKNILEHISLMAQEQVQLEFREQMQQMMQMQQMAATDPRMQQQLQALNKSS